MGDKRVGQAFLASAVSGGGHVGRRSGSKADCGTVQASSSCLLSRLARSVSSSGVSVVSKDLALRFAAFDVLGRADGGDAEGKKGAEGFSK